MSKSCQAVSTAGLTSNTSIPSNLHPEFSEIDNGASKTRKRKKAEIESKQIELSKLKIG